jgi:hypothetical protein
VLVEPPPAAAIAPVAIAPVLSLRQSMRDILGPAALVGVNGANIQMEEPTKASTDDLARGVAFWLAVVGAVCVVGLHLYAVFFI